MCLVSYPDYQNPAHIEKCTKNNPDSWADNCVCSNCENGYLSKAEIQEAKCEMAEIIKQFYIELPSDAMEGYENANSVSELGYGFVSIKYVCSDAEGWLEECEAYKNGKVDMTVNEYIDIIEDVMSIEQRTADLYKEQPAY